MGTIDTKSKISKFGTVVDDNVSYATSSTAKFCEIPAEIWGDVFSHVLDAPFVPAVKNTHQLAMAHPHLSAALRTSGSHREQVELLKNRIALVGAICDVASQMEADNDRVSFVLPLYRLLTQSQQRTIDTHLKKLAKIPQDLKLISLDTYSLQSLTDPTRVWVEHSIRHATSIPSSERLQILQTCTRAGIEHYIVDPNWLNWMDATDRSNFVDNALKDPIYFMYLLQATPSSLSDEEFLLIADVAVRNHLMRVDLTALPQLYFDSILYFLKQNLFRLDTKISDLMIKIAMEQATFRGMSIICLVMHQSLIKSVEQEVELIDRAVSNFTNNCFDLQFIFDALPAWSDSAKKKFFILIASRFDDAQFSYHDKVSWIVRLAFFWENIPLTAREELQAAIFRCKWAEVLNTEYVLSTYSIVSRGEFIKFPKELLRIVTEQVRSLHANIIPQIQAKVRCYLSDDDSNFNVIDFIKMLAGTINFLSKETQIELLKTAHLRLSTQGLKDHDGVMFYCIKSLVTSYPEMLSLDASIRNIFESHKRAAEVLLEFVRWIPKDDLDAVLKLNLCLAEDEPNAVENCLRLLQASRKAPRSLRLRVSTLLIDSLKERSGSQPDSDKHKHLTMLANDDSFWA